MDNSNAKDLGIPSSKDSNKNVKETCDEATTIIEWIYQIQDENRREMALAELSRKRESFADLALYLWYSTGTVFCLLQEIINTYQYLAPPVLNLQSSNRACNVLALFQCIAAHPDTRPAFLAAQIPIFLYPFLNTVNKNKPFEYLRLTALGVIGALVKIDNTEVIAFLLSTEIIPLCLRIMERGSELSKTVATFIVQRILLDDSGLNYVCNTAERFYAISSVLSNMINSNPSTRLVKHIIRSYARLSENSRVRTILRDNLPLILKDKQFYLSLDESSKKWLAMLSKALVNIPSEERTASNGSSLGVLNQIGGMGNISNINNIGTINNLNHANSLGNMNGINSMNSYLINQDPLGNGFSYNGYDYDGLKSSNYPMSTNNINTINNPTGKNYLNLNAGPFNFKNGK